MATHSGFRFNLSDGRGLEFAFVRPGVFGAQECKALTAWAEMNGILSPQTAGRTAREGTAEDQPGKQPVSYSWNEQVVIDDQSFGTDLTITKRYKQIIPAPGTRAQAVTRVRRKLCEYVKALNEQIWSFQVTRLSPLLIIRYEAGDELGLHVDLVRGQSDRKLLAFVQLSADDSYTGGELGFGVPLAAAPRDQGSLLIFPAWVPHRVLPVTSGVRYTAVCCALGPPFR